MKLSNRNSIFIEITLRYGFSLGFCLSDFKELIPDDKKFNQFYTKKERKKMIQVEINHRLFKGTTIILGTFADRQQIY